MGWIGSSSAHSGCMCRSGSSGSEISLGCDPDPQPEPLAHPDAARGRLAVRRPGGSTVRCARPRPDHPARRAWDGFTWLVVLVAAIATFLWGRIVINGALRRLNARRSTLMAPRRRI